MKRRSVLEAEMLTCMGQAYLKKEGYIEAEKRTLCPSRTGWEWVRKGVEWWGGKGDTCLSATVDRPMHRFIYITYIIS